MTCLPYSIRHFGNCERHSSEEALSFLWIQYKKTATLLNNDIKPSIRFRVPYADCAWSILEQCVQRSAVVHISASLTVLYPRLHYTFSDQLQERGIYNQNIGSEKEIYTKTDAYGSVSKAIMPHKFSCLPSRGCKNFLRYPSAFPITPALLHHAFP